MKSLTTTNIILLPCYPTPGSAHCALAPYWFNKLYSIENDSIKKTMTGYQDSSRGGCVTVELVVNKEGQHRVLLSGPCVTVLKATVVV